MKTLTFKLLLMMAACMTYKHEQAQFMQHLQWSGGASVNFGSSKLKWEYYSELEDISIDRKLETWLVEAHLNVGYRIDDCHTLGFRLAHNDWKMGKYGFQLAPKIPEESLCMFYSRLKSCFSNSMNLVNLDKVTTFYLGYSFMHLKHANRQLINYSLPYDMKLQWQGFVLGVSRGFLFYIGNSDFYLHPHWKILYQKRYLTKLSLEDEAIDIRDESTLRSTTYGFELVVGYDM